MHEPRANEHIEVNVAYEAVALRAHRNESDYTSK